MLVTKALNKFKNFTRLNKKKEKKPEIYFTKINITFLAFKNGSFCNCFLKNKHKYLYFNNTLRNCEYKRIS